MGDAKSGSFPPVIRRSGSATDIPYSQAINKYFWIVTEDIFCKNLDKLGHFKIKIT